MNEATKQKLKWEAKPPAHIVAMYEAQGLEWDGEKFVASQATIEGRGPWRTCIRSPSPTSPVYPSSPPSEGVTFGVEYVSSETRTLEPTMGFRWCHINVGDEKGRLQQAWSVRETGQIEWRDVPHFYEPKP